VPIDGVRFGSIMRPLFRGLAISASGLSAQRQRIETIAHNVANAETTRTPEGGPYRRRVVQLEAKPFQVDGVSATVSGAVPGAVVRSGPVVVTAPGVPPIVGPEVEPPRVSIPGVFEPPVEAGGVRVAGVAEDASEGPLVYDPGHPDADEAGYVRYPNVRITEEMIDLLEARRVYEANATVFQAVKAMLKRAIDI
jgi:flagellar basal-body rod protein FlgC